MEQESDLVIAVGEYILAKVDWTECMQKHFKQLCYNCKNYTNCQVYSNYVDKWMRLQHIYGGVSKK